MGESGCKAYSRCIRRAGFPFLVLRQVILHKVCGVTGQELSVWQGGNQYHYTGNWIVMNMNNTDSKATQLNLNLKEKINTPKTPKS